MARPFLVYTEAFDGPIQFTQQGVKPGKVLGDLVDRTSFAPLHKLGRWAGLIHQRPVIHAFWTAL
ncbi:MAG: hypothetical protein GY742_17015 [Hyphomicrobiales bacterium]|nr:hypothetical protein [Hyphomicrobiales bacterium]